MRMPIAMMLAAAIAVSPLPALAQDNAAATTADTADVAAPAPEDANAVAADANIVAIEMAPPTAIAPANDAAAMPAPAPRGRPFPWGVIGLIGLIGLLGSRRG